MPDRVRKRDGKRPRTLRRANAKNVDVLCDQVVEHIRRGIAQRLLADAPGSRSVTREAIARYLDVPEHQVEQVFQRLVRNGKLSRAANEGAHDSTRAWFFAGPFSGWAPTYWELRDFEWWQRNDSAA